MAKPPTSDIGRPDLAWGTWGQGLLSEWFESAADLIWPQSVITYGRMRHDPQIKAVLGGYRMPLMRATWVIDPSGCRDVVVQHVADDLGLPILGADDKPSPARRRGVDWYRHLREAINYIVFGHMPFERRYEIVNDPKMDGGKYTRLINLGARMPWTIAQMKIDDHGQLEYIEQTTQRPPIPGSRLVWYTNEQEGSNWAGTSCLRPAFGAWLLKHETWRVHATSIRRFGMGVPTVEAPQGATQQQVIQAQQLASSMRAGDQSGMGLPQGFKASLMGLTGSVPDALAFIRYLDQSMAKMMMEGMIELGQTETGSRALGESFFDLFQLALQGMADEIATTATSGHPGLPGIVTDLVDQNWGEDEPAPRIVCTDVGENYDITAEALRTLTQSGALSPDPALDEWIRKTWRLPKRATAWEPTSRGIPAPNAPAGPIENVPGELGLPELAPTSKGTPPPKAPPKAPPVTAAARKPVPGYVAASGWRPEDHQAEWEQALAALLLRYRVIMSAQRTDLVDRVITAMENGRNLALTPPDVLHGPNLIRQSMVSLAERAAESMVAEAASQGVHINLEAVRIDAAAMDPIAQGRAAVSASHLAQQATVKGMQVYGRGPAGFVRAADEVDKYLSGLSNQSLRDQLGAALTAAQNQGRMAVLAAAPQSAGFPVDYVAAEFLDKNTCDNCRKEDGTTFGSLEDAEAAYPTGGFIECQGLMRCRGTVVAVWGSPPSTPVHPAQAAAGIDTHPADAERLRRYWEHGEGAAKIGWGIPGDFDRCVVEVVEHAHMTPEQAKGYCAERHHGATGQWPGQHGGKEHHGKEHHAKFNPLEPRDEDGKWSDGIPGGGVGTLSKIYNDIPETRGPGRGKGSYNGPTGRDLADQSKQGHSVTHVVDPITDAEARDSSRAVTDAEYQELARRGVNRLGRLRAMRSPIEGLDRNWPQIKADAWEKTRESWGGVTIDAHTGQPLDTHADKFALSVKKTGMHTVSVPEHATQDEFNAALDQAQARFRGLLEGSQSFLGVFHDDENNRIDIDPVLVVDTKAEVEEIGAYAHSIGGAYHFASGDGFYPPHVAASAKAAADGKTVSFAGPGQWRSEADRVQPGLSKKQEAEIEAAAKQNPKAKFNPLERRDRDGKWTSGPAGKLLDILPDRMITNDAVRKAATSKLAKKTTKRPPLPDYDTCVEAVTKELERAADDPFALKHGKDWYPAERRLAEERAKKYNVPVHIAAAVESATSPRCGYARNQRVTEDLLDKVPGILDGTSGKQLVAEHRISGGVLPDNLDMAIKILDGAPIETTLTGDKRRSFYTNIVSPGKSDMVTIDAWMQLALSNPLHLDREQADALSTEKGKLFPAGLGRTLLADATRKAGAKHGLSPDQMQAVYWIWSKANAGDNDPTGRSEGGRPASGVGASAAVLDDLDTDHYDAEVLLGYLAWRKANIPGRIDLGPPASAREDDSNAADNDAAWIIVMADPRWKKLGWDRQFAERVAGRGVAD